MSGPRMMPAEIPSAVRADPKRRAEVEVFERLRDDPLLAGFTVYYSCWWTAEHNGMLRDGEADFIAAHPDVGFIAIEVKGGEVSRRAYDDTWWSKGSGGRVHSIQDPVAQARKSKKVFLDSMKREWPGSPPFVWARHGAILPHSGRPKATRHLGAAMPLEIFAFEEDMPKLGARLMQMMMWRPEGSNEPIGRMGQTGIDILDGLYGGDFVLERNLSTRISQNETTILQLTEQQKRLLDVLSLQRRALIVGGAGTGKSVLALEKATRLAAAGSSILMLCFNKPLSIKIQTDAAATPNLTVETFHGCCTRIAESGGLHPRRHKAKNSRSEYYSKVLPQLLGQAIDGEPKERFDAVIVDEGQDFQPAWLETLQRLVREDGHFVVFADANQSIYQKYDLADALKAQPLLLCDNIRNTRQIFQTMSQFYAGPQQTGCGPDGPEVRWIEADGSELKDVIGRQINELVLIEGIAPEEIAVLTGCALASSALETAASLGEYPLTNASEPREGHITLDSVYRFKGLDSSVVILAEMDGSSAEPELPYVALSRAKGLMIVIGAAATLEYLESGPFDQAAA